MNKGIFFLCWSLATLAHADNTSLIQTKTKLTQVEQQIKRLKISLSENKTKKGKLYQELASNEKLISHCILELRQINQKITQIEVETKKIESQISDLKMQLSAQQNLLAQHLNARYRLGPAQPFKWFFNEDDANNRSRLLTYYLYLIRSRQKAIENVQNTQNLLKLSQQKLKKSFEEQARLKEQLMGTQQKLQQQKKFSEKLILSVTNEIKTGEEKLAEVEHNKIALTGLIQRLAQKTILLSQTPFWRLHRKLPKPVMKFQSIKKENQGLVFIAREGEPIQAVHSGKVLFSDWLKGYGLLLIIDHGQGYMTLYAHNQSLFKQKGDIIQQGEQIASVGHTGGIRENRLYFEIRHRGKAIPPLEWLS